MILSWKNCSKAQLALGTTGDLGLIPRGVKGLTHCKFLQEEQLEQCSSYKGKR